MIGLLLGLAVAAPPDLELVWNAPEGCPTQAEVELRVADLVGRPVTVGPEAAWAVRVDVRRAGAAQWRADVVLKTSRGEARRPLRAGACDPLADAVAVIVALALDDAPPPETTTATSAFPTALSPRVVRPRQRAETGPERWPTAWAVGVEALAHGGLSDPGVGLGVDVGVRRAGFAMSVGAVHLRSGVAAAAASETVRVQVLGARLRGCAPLLRPRPWFADVCLVGQAGRAEVHARGRAEGSRAVGWAEAGPEIALGFAAQGPWAAALRLRLQVALARPEAVVVLDDGVVAAFRAPRFSAGVGLSIRGDFFLTD